ncbi:MAG: hypothetical protein M3463_14835 [Verrucomicrobiota bacterium]|nr:hypothetical protein [Verrucomicrobiota bacterium]
MNPILRLSLFSFLLVFAVAAPAALGAGKVTLMRTPNGGIQPQVVADEKGAVHLIYLQGDPKACDVFYVRKEQGQDRGPLRVNSQPRAAVAMGTVRGAHLALGKSGRVHVAWNGSYEGAPKGPEGRPLSAMNYARLNDAGTAFEPQQNLMKTTTGLDGGGSVAADGHGNVYVTWHAREPDAPPGEAGRAVYVAHSTDEGKTFAAEKRANVQPTGACGCCGMKSLADAKGNFYALYRGAANGLNRDMMLLTSRNRGASFDTSPLHKWQIGRCPMSSESLIDAGSSVVAAWETADQVYFASIDSATGKASAPVAPAGSAGRKHPVVVRNAKGETLLAWTEGTGWQKGGSLAWQLFDANGNPGSELGRADGVPVWSLVAAYARPDGNFVILH